MKRKLYGIKMIPSGLVTCFANGAEVRVIEISPEGIRFRMAERWKYVSSLSLKFLHIDKKNYQEIVLKNYSYVDEEEEKFYFTYLVLVDDEVYRREVQELYKVYGRYVQNKLSGDDILVAHDMLDYPIYKEDEHFENLHLQKIKWFSEWNLGQKGKLVNMSNIPEIAICLDSENQYCAYMEKDAESYLKWYWKRYHLEKHPLAKFIPKRFYIGNAFCHVLFPKESILFALMQKAVDENFAITLVFSYLRQSQIKKTKELLETVLEWCLEKNVEIEWECNDWGMLKLLDEVEEEKRIWIGSRNLGLLLNKYRKDPRLKYKIELEHQSMYFGKTNLNAKFYVDYLKKRWKIARFEWETCGYLHCITHGRNSIHLPFYQTNTSQFCPLYAIRQYQNRGYQKLPEKCPKYCQEQGILYPKHLNMMGYYNSIFGYDKTALQIEQLQKLCENKHIDRLVVNLL